MKNSQIDEAISLLRAAVSRWLAPAVTIVSQRDGNAFKVLVSCILSLRTKDEITASAVNRLFSIADTPKSILGMSVEDIERSIYPVGFYRKKARQILDICNRLLTVYDGKVPDNLDTLLDLKGVGRKTANLVITLGFGKPGICVDTHVHRICNRWGYVKTATPEQTEFALRSKLPKEYWICINDLLVSFGQNHCRPISPKCNSCFLSHLCVRNGVKMSR